MEVQRGAILPAKKDRLWPKTHTQAFLTVGQVDSRENKRKRANQPSMRWPLAWQEKWAIIKKGHQQQQQQSTNVRLKHKCNNKNCVRRRSLRPSLRLSSLSLSLSLSSYFTTSTSTHLIHTFCLIYRSPDTTTSTSSSFCSEERERERESRQIRLDTGKSQSINSQKIVCLLEQFLSEWVRCAQRADDFMTSQQWPPSHWRRRENTQWNLSTAAEAGIKSEISVNNRHAAWSVSIDWPREKTKSKRMPFLETPATMKRNDSRCKAVFFTVKLTDQVDQAA